MTRYLLSLALLLLPGGASAQQVPDPVSAQGALLYFPKNFGACTWDATHDVGACINLAMAAAAAAGGGTVSLPAGTYGVSTPITTSSDGVAVVCNQNTSSQKASEPYGASPADTAGCELKWIGSAGGKIMSFSAADDSKFLVGARVHDVRFNGNNGLAAGGLYLRTTYGGDFRGLSFVGGFAGGNVIELDVVPGEHVVPHGTQYNHFTDTGIFNNGFTSNGLKLGYYQSATGQGANASVNMFDNLHIYTGSGTTGKAIWCLGCDNNTFRTAYLSVPGGIAVDLDIYTANGRWFQANNNVFDKVAWGFPGGTAVARGKTTYPACTGFNFPSLGNCTWGNEFRTMDGSNGTPPPVVEPGAYVKYSIDYGVSVNTNALLAGDGQRPSQLIMQHYDGLHECGNDALANGANTGTYYCIENNTALTFSNGKATAGQIDRFTIGLNGGTPGAENLLYGHSIGTGKHIFEGAAQVGNTLMVGAVPAACGSLGVQGSLCLNAGGQTGVELADGTVSWLMRQNAAHELELGKIGNASGLRIANSNFPQVWFTGPATLANTIVANLPVCNAGTKYSLAAVSDQNGAPTYRGTLTGGGSLAAMAFCNGTAWEAH